VKKAPEAAPGPLVVGIETATVLGGVAVVSGAGVLLGEITLRNHESHSERLLPALEWLLATLGLSLRQCAAVAVAQGPGSFTGLRAGIATAKGLAFSLAVPLYGVPTLDALAANAPPGETRVCAVLNARRGEVFHAPFRHGDAGWQRLGPDSLTPLAALAGELPAGCLVVGELPSSFAALLPAGHGLRFLPPHLNHPRAAVVAAVGNAARGASRASELATLMPRYLRPFDAAATRPKT
jgi:tRNA threonylcarbamoyladenosine biosynthesis protein TsaB